MATTISVNKQSVLELLSTGRTKPFVIPVTSIDSDWTLGNIEHRDKLVTSDIMKLLNFWDSQYSNFKPATGSNEPTQEDLNKIKKYKELGWI